MKKRLLWITTIVAIVLACLAFTACIPKVEGGDDSPAKDYQASETNANIDAMRNENGIYLKYEGVVDGEEKEDGTFVFAAKGDVFYYASNDEVTIYDLSNAEYSVEYHQANANAEWTATITYYDETTTKATKEQEVRETAQAILTMATYYDEEESDDEVGGMKKETAELLGRECDKYSLSFSMGSLARGNTSVWIDKATGICLRWSANASALGQGGGVNFECKEFKESYTAPQIPEVSEENTTIVEAHQTGTTTTIAQDYPDLKKALRTLIATGVDGEFEITANGEDPYTVKLAAKGDLFYLYDGTNGSETYADLSDESKYVLYTRSSAEAEWTVEETRYDDESAEYASKEDLIASFEKSLDGVYEVIEHAGNTQLKKETTTYLGREVFKYSGNVNYGVGSATINVYVDKETGMVLFDSVGSNGVVKIAGSVECKSFKLGDDVVITLPETGAED